MRFVLLFVPVLLFAQVKEIPGKYTYLEALHACKKLGKEWRITEIWELFKLRGQVKRFGKGKLYWSGNTLGEARIEKNIRHESEIFVQNRSIPAFAFYLQDGDITPTPKETKAHVICMDEQKVHQLDRHFKKLANGMVADYKNKIYWEPYDKKRDAKKLRYEDAQRYCENLHLFGRSWRLPTVDELYSIVNYNYVKPAVNKAIFGHMHHKYYVSDDEFNDDEVYVVGFAVGSVATGPINERYYFRCVSDMDEVAKTYGIFDPYLEIQEIIESKKKQKRKLQELLDIVKRYELDRKSAQLIYRFLKSITDKEVQHLKQKVLRNIRIKSQLFA
ncbi:MULTISPECIES: DUF1566 domain-containing protein [unclassified Nitratiruptor]|uniref:Lcl C-terminal domain-containing protein n=1 Tax=unclassified Nitratiruptor TaxID=2624044 RepID=UPI001914F7EB|nr:MULTISPECIES: DUF1566 domain-containing protein [unclassified Nitratiruptor]BCD60134.1 hypothetical protein NitYY0810_C0899 [Nitratiruptor sp. YY08-10]BCD64377.1 hypothetical protein NitYY0814_C1222 [Nitratiruptor sp. YY08-14]